MAYGLKFWHEYGGRSDGKLVRLELHYEGFGGADTEIPKGVLDEGMLLGVEDAVSYTAGTSVASKTLEVSLVASAGFSIDDLYVGSERDIRVLLTLDSAVLFDGFMVPFITDEAYMPMSSKPQLKLQAKCGIKRLGNVDFDILDFAIDERDVSLKDLIAYCMGKLDHGAGYRVFNNLYGLPEPDVDNTADPLAAEFRNIGDFDGLSCLEVLEYLCYAQHMVLVQISGFWHFMRVAELEPGTSVRGTQYDLDGTNAVAVTYDNYTRAGNSLSEAINSLDDVLLSMESGIKQIRYKVDYEGRKNYLQTEWTGSTGSIYGDPGWGSTSFSQVNGDVRIWGMVAPNASPNDSDDTTYVYIDVPLLLVTNNLKVSFTVKRTDADIAKAKMTVEIYLAADPNTYSYYINREGVLEENPTTITIDFTDSDTVNVDFDIHYNGYPFAVLADMIKVKFYRGIEVLEGATGYGDLGIELNNLNLNLYDNYLGDEYSGELLELTNDDHDHNEKIEETLYFGDVADSNYTSQLTKSGGVALGNWRMPGETLNNYTLQEYIARERMAFWGKLRWVLNGSFEGDLGFFTLLDVADMDNRKFMPVSGRYDLYNDVYTNVRLIEWGRVSVNVTAKAFSVRDDEEVAGGGSRFFTPGKDYITKGGGTVYGTLVADGGLDAVAAGSDNSRAANKGVLNIGASYADLIKIGKAAGATDLYGSVLAKSGEVSLLKEGNEGTTALSWRNLAGDVTDNIAPITNGFALKAEGSSYAFNILTANLTAEVSGSLPVTATDFVFATDATAWMLGATNVLTAKSYIGSDSGAYDIGIKRAGTEIVTVKSTGIDVVGKMTSATAAVTGLTTNYLPYVGASGLLTDSIIQRNATGIGIGISPSAKLEVAGALRISGTGTNVVNLQTASAGSVDRLDFVAQATNKGINLQLTPNGSSVLSKIALSNQNSSTNFGSVFLEANGATGYLSPQSVGSPTTALTSLSLGGGSGFTNWTNVVIPGGNVGIGTASPAYKLDVNGTARIVGTLKLDTGAASGYILQSDASGNASWVSPTSVQSYQGTWNPTTNNPSLNDGSGTQGHFYRILNTYSRDLGSGSIEWTEGYDIRYNGSVWQELPVGSLAIASASVLGGIKTGSTMEIDGAGVYNQKSGIVTTGTYKSVTVDTYGRVTAGTNPTTIAGYGITDFDDNADTWWMGVNNATTAYYPKVDATGNLVDGAIFVSGSATWITGGTVLAGGTSFYNSDVTDINKLTVSKSINIRSSLGSTYQVLANAGNTGGDGSIFHEWTTIDGANYLSDWGVFANDITVNGLTVGKGNSAVAANVALGVSALNANTTGNSNAAIGSSALLLNTTGSENIAIGNSALRPNVSGGNNIGIGGRSLYANTTGSDSIAIGRFSLSGNISGGQNVAIGTRAGQYIADGTTANAVSNNSVFLGYGTKANATGEANQIVIGYDVIGLGSNTVTIGNSSITDNYFNGVIHAKNMDGWDIISNTGNFLLTDEDRRGLLLSDVLGEVGFIGKANSAVGGVMVYNSISDKCIHLKNDGEAYWDDKRILTTDDIVTGGEGGSQTIDQVLATGYIASNRTIEFWQNTDRDIFQFKTLDGATLKGAFSYVLGTTGTFEESDRVILQNYESTAEIGVRADGIVQIGNYTQDNYILSDFATGVSQDFYDGGVIKAVIDYSSGFYLSTEYTTLRGSNNTLIESQGDIAITSGYYSGDPASEVKINANTSGGTLGNTRIGRAVGTNYIFLNGIKYNFYNGLSFSDGEQLIMEYDSATSSFYMNKLITPLATV